MALKSPPNKIPNSNHENDPSETEKEASSQNNTQSTRRKFKPIQKKNRKKSSNKSTPCPNPRTQSHARMPMVPMVPPPVVPVSNMAAFYGGQNLMYPAPYPPWDEAARWGFHSPFYRFPFQPVPMPMLPPPPVLFPPVCPYSGGFPYPPPAIVPMVPPPVVIEEIVPMPQCHQNQNYYSPERTVPNELGESYCEFESVNDPPFYDAEDSLIGRPRDHIDFCLSLPKDLFPSAMMLPLDPNLIIDGFCRYGEVLDHAPWIMDLEFGVPREATTRTIAIYDVKYNSIHCKNTPDAIHPGFESCDPEFRNLLTFYYDCVFSTWYRSYITLNQDRSVENFQSWLSTPMQEFGMCWL